MSKEVLISIRPEWVEKIMNGEKTLEVRKTRPKLETPFKVYIYCTSGRPDLNIPISPERLMRDYLDTGSMRSLNCPLGNGKVVGEFMCDKIDCVDIPYPAFMGKLDKHWTEDSCCTYYQLHRYFYHDRAYFWHISDLKIYDMPRAISEFTPNCRFLIDDGECQYRKVLCDHQRIDYNQDGSPNVVPCERRIQRPPQSWCYVEELK